MDRAGVYDYLKVKKTGSPVWQRHEGCGCSIEFYDQNGKKEMVNNFVKMTKRSGENVANGVATKYQNQKDNPVAKSGKSGIIKSSNIVQESIDSGKVKLEINPEKQNRHIKDGNGHTEGRSYLHGGIEEAQRIVDELHGTGQPVPKPDGTWTRKERVEADRIIGVKVNPDTLEETETSKAMIVYSKTGTHVIPR